jgi:catechol 2,3-dioxygenase
MIHPDTSLGAVHLTVSALARSLEFYRGTLGFNVLRQDEAVAELGTGSAPLVVLSERPGATPKPPNTTGLYHFAILLPARADLARALRQLSDTHYPIQGASDHLVSEALYLADPDGNGIEIYADRPRSAWTYRSGQLQMATAALDVEGLMKELKTDPRPWNGLPQATRIGHIHLHVSDLPAAEAFYRDVLGFDLVLRYGTSAGFLSAGGYHHHIGLNTWAGVGAPPPPPDALGLRWFTIAVPDRAEADGILRRAQAAGASHEDQPNGTFLRDPSGNSMLVTN